MIEIRFIYTIVQQSAGLYTSIYCTALIESQNRRMISSSLSPSLCSILINLNQIPIQSTLVITNPLNEPLAITEKLG